MSRDKSIDHTYDIMKYLILNDFLRLGKALNASILLCPTKRKHAGL